MFSKMNIYDTYIQRIPVIGYIVDAEPSTIKFKEVITGIEYESLMVLAWTIVHDIAVNEQFVVALARDDQVVQIFETLDFLDYSLVVSVTLEELQKQQPELDRFEPQEVKLSPIDPNVLFIRGTNNIVVIRMTSSGMTLLNILDFE